MPHDVEDILDSLNHFANHPNPSESELDRLASLAAFDMSVPSFSRFVLSPHRSHCRLLMKSLNLIETEANSSEPSAVPQETWINKRPELREVYDELHSEAFEVCSPRCS